MRSDLLLSTQSFIDTFSAPNYAERSKAIAKNASSSAGELKQNTNDESFEAFMNDLKARQAAEKSQNNAARNNENTQNTDTKKEVKTKSINPFLTQIAGTSLAEESISENDDIVFDIYTQMEEIIQELERLMAAQDKSEKSTITTEIPEENLDSLKDLKILSLFARVSENTDDPAVQAPKDVLAQAMSDLRKIIEDNKEGLITLNKSPEELAELQKIIEDILKAQIDKQNQKMLEELAAQWATIEIVKPATTQLNETSLAQNENTEIIDEQTSFTQNKSLNDLSLRYDDRYQINRYAKDSQSATLSDAQTDTAKSNSKDILPSVAQNKLAEDSANQTNKSELLFSKLLNGSTSLPPLPIMTAQGDVLYTDQNGTVIAATQGNSAQPSLINNAAHSPHASQPHPATQAIVTTISKAIKSGETSEIKIQLDPPELGRVEVKMSIDQDNITRVVLTSEKAETHTLLQRDSHVLQQLLTDSGLLPDGSSLSFELSDGHAQNFSSNKERNGKTSGKEDTYSEIIETTMDWKVDPRTGVMHYNILA